MRHLIRLIHMLSPIIMALVFAFIFGCSHHSAPTSSNIHPAHPISVKIDLTNPDQSENTLLIRQSEKAKIPTGSTLVLSDEAIKYLQNMLEAYFAVGRLLAEDKYNTITSQSRILLSALDQLKSVVNQEDLDMIQILERTHQYGQQLASSSSIQYARKHYGFLSHSLLDWLHKLALPVKIYGFVCGMAPHVPQKGVWLQSAAEVRNPYFGSTMLKCYSQTFKLETSSLTTQGGSNDQ